MDLELNITYSECLLLGSFICLFIGWPPSELPDYLRASRTWYIRQAPTAQDGIRAVGSFCLVLCCAEIMYQCRGSCRLVIRGTVVLVTASSSQWYGASCPNWLMMGDLSYLLCSLDPWPIFFLSLWFPNLPLSPSVLLYLLPAMPLLLESVRAAFLDYNQELSSMLLRNPGYLLQVGCFTWEKMLPQRAINRNGTEGEDFTLLFFTTGLKASATWRTSLVGRPKECERRLRGTVENHHARDLVEFFHSQSLPGPVNSCYGIFWDSDTLSSALGCCILYCQWLDLLSDS